MVLNATTQNSGAPASEGVYYISTFNFTPRDESRPTYTAPNLLGNEWDPVYAGVCVDEEHQGSAENQLVLAGDKLMLSHPTQLAFFLRADDIGDLLISTAENLSADEVKQRVQNTPVYDKGQLQPVGDIHLQFDLAQEKWQEADSGAASWRNVADSLVLPDGTYYIYGLVTNKPFPNGNNINNRKLFRYAIQAKRVLVRVVDGQPEPVPLGVELRGWF